MRGRYAARLLATALAMLAGCAPDPQRAARDPQVAVILPDALRDIGQYALCPPDDEGRYQLFHEAGLGCRGGFVFAGLAPASRIADQIVPLPQGGVLAVYTLKPPGLLASRLRAPGRYILAARSQGETRPKLFRPAVAMHRLMPGKVQLLGKATAQGISWPRTPPSASGIAAALSLPVEAISASPPQIVTVTCEDRRSPVCVVD
ncbi:MAG: hypothetical protein AAGC92_11315 [Pseudomonadota bacterium]